MVRRLTQICLLTLACGVLMAGAAQARVPRGWMGVVSNYELTSAPREIPSELRIMSRNGVQSLRTTFDWSQIEPARGTFHWRVTDALVRSAARRHIALLPTVLSAPVWAGAHGLYKNSVMLIPRNPADYAAFLTTLIRRYGPRGSFWRAHRGLPRRPVRSWQVWNEPNGTYFWYGRPWPSSYVRLLKVAHAAIKRADPGARVVLAGLSGRFWNHLASLYRAGARRYFDAAALHDYTHNPRSDANTVFSMLQALRWGRGAMRRHGDGRKPILVTEFGWPSSAGKIKKRGTNAFIGTTVKGQGRLLTKMYLALARNRHRLGIAGAYYFDWISRDRFNYDAFLYAGLRTTHGGRHSKPALAAYRRVAHRLER